MPAHTHSRDTAEKLSIAEANRWISNNPDGDDTLTLPTFHVKRFLETIEGEKILDVGCGWGHYVYEFLDANLDYLGVDHANKMVQAARRHNPTATFKKMSVFDLNLPNETFDAVWSCCVFTSIPKADLPAALDEIKRVMRKNALMMIVMPDEGISYEELIEDDTGSPRFWHTSYRLHELAGVFEESGFFIVEGDVNPPDGSMHLIVCK